MLLHGQPHAAIGGGGSSRRSPSCCAPPLVRNGTQSRPHRTSRVQPARTAQLERPYAALSAQQPEPAEAEQEFVEGQPEPEGSQNEGSQKAAWWQRPSLWVDVANVQELATAITAGKEDGKLVVLDFYSGNCPSCRAAFPKLCAIPAKDAKLREKYHFFKANAQEPSLMWWVKRNAVMSIPYLIVFGPTGNRLLALTASFKRMPAIKTGLHTIVDNPQATRFGMNAEGVIEVLG